MGLRPSFILPADQTDQRLSAKYPVPVTPDTLFAYFYLTDFIRSRNTRTIVLHVDRNQRLEAAPIGGVESCGVLPSGLTPSEKHCAVFD